MKIITLHCDYIRFKPLKKAIKDVESIEEKEEIEVKEPLVILTAIEKGDSPQTLQELVQAVTKTAENLKAKSVVLYPYAHLSSNLASPKQAQEYLEKAEILLAKKLKVTRAPFGYYKSFELKVKGHPLSELSKEFKPAAEESSEEPSKELKSSKENLHEEDYDLKKLVKEISRSRLDTSKLKENDHRIIGQKLDLFSFNETSPGMVFFHDSGLFIYNQLIEYMRALLRKFEYQEVSTPQIFDSKLFKLSGHWSHYRENMFLTDYEQRDFAVKPMNCPGNMLVYKATQKSYKDLPIRMAEFGIVHRKELSGVLAGLFRVVRFTQDDAHIFCTSEQLESEIEQMLKLIKIIFKDTFGFKTEFELSTRPEKFLGEIAEWNNAEKTLEKVLKKSKLKYKINKGDGAFYGPKIDMHIKDSLGRSWQCSTIQFDMQMPKRFDLNYTDSDDKTRTPLMLHRAIFGSLERFIGILLEHLNGNLPLWLSPRQVRVINFTDRNTKACEKFVKELKTQIPQIRVDTDLRSETVQSKVRDAELLKINYIVVIGDKEEKAKTLAVRPRGTKPKFGIKPKKFLEDLKKELRGPYKKF